MQAPTGQQTVLPSYEQAVRNPTSSEFQTATAPPMNYEGSYPRQTSYPVQAPYPTQQQQQPYPTQQQQSYPTQPQPYPTQQNYLTQQPLYPTQQPPYPTQQQQSYHSAGLPYEQTYGHVIAPGTVTARPTIHVIRHVSTGNTGCSGANRLFNFINIFLYFF